MSSQSRSMLHLMGHFDNPHTGAERELLDIRDLIGGRQVVQLWSDVPPHAFYASKGVRQIRPFAQQFPKDGTLLLAGVHVRLDMWMQYARFSRVIALYNLPSHERLFRMMDSLRQLTRCEPELVVVSQALQLSVGLPSRVINSVIDLKPFLAIEKSRSAAAPFTVGRVSRDIGGKHHPDDPSLYRMLAAHGVRVRVMGGTSLAPQLTGVDGIELLPAGAESTVQFHRSLDVFFYRTGTFAESYGRVVMEAMASALPVVASPAGGYAEHIRQGVDGWLVHSQEEAYDTLMGLKQSSGSVAAMGVAARQNVVARHGDEANERLMQAWLLNPEGSAL